MLTPRLRLPTDCKPRDEYGQFVHEWPVDRNAEWLLREQLAASDDNAALTHQPDGNTEHSPFLCVRGKKSAHDIGCSRQTGGCIRRKEFTKDLGGMRTLSSEHANVAAHFVAEQ
jgi:hypothetical protein